MSILGKIAGTSTTYNSNTTNLINNLTYLPFGPAKGMDMGTGSAVNNLFNELYRMTVANPGAEKEQTYTYDANGNITSINVTNNVDKNQTFTYDSLNRLLTATGVYGPISYTYDKVGNRLIKTMDDQTETYNYITGTNKLQEIIGPNPLTFTYDPNGNTTEIGEKVGCNRITVRKWRRRFLELGIDGLKDMSRSGHPLEFTAQERAEVLAMATRKPEDEGKHFTDWSVRELANHVVEKGIVESISPATVFRWLREADIKPHKWEYWLNSTDPDFLKK